MAREARMDALRVAKCEEQAPLPDVRAVIETYIAMRDVRASKHAGRSVRSDAASRLTSHVLGDAELSSMELSRLSEEALNAWCERVQAGLKGASKQRLINDLKAAFNLAYREFRKRLPPDFAETVRHGLSGALEGTRTDPIARESQILADDQIRAIIAAAIEDDDDGDFARLVIVLAATGARFSQVRRMQVRDVQFEHSRLFVPTSRKGKNRLQGHVGIKVGADVLDALKPAVEGRASSDVLLCRWRHVQIGPAKWERASRGSWQAASEMLRPWRALCEKQGLKGIVPYSLRHSSIVRGLRAGLPIRLVAALHDTSVAMIERHYARWITDGLEELAAKAIVPLVSTRSSRQEMVVAFG